MIKGKKRKRNPAKWIEYEIRKKELWSKNLSPPEYDHELAKIVTELKI